jgi:hypothetical protein
MKKGVDGSVQQIEMAVIFEQAKGGTCRKWECKQCHRLVAESATVAYHLVDGILYGWCEDCFGERRKVAVELVA